MNVLWAAALASCMVAVAIVLLFIWILVASDREGQMVDEPPTLDTRNHLDD